MKLERLVIGVLILVCVWLAFHKVPKNGVDIKYITKYEKRIDTLIKDTIVYKTKIRRFKDTIIIFRDSVREAKENNDTVKIITFQDSVIEQQDYTIKWQDTLIGQLDTIIMYQNRVNDKLKDSVIDLNKKKKKRKLLHILSVIGISTLFIVK
jgi:hypothetical protein